MSKITVWADVMMVNLIDVISEWHKAAIFSSNWTWCYSRSFIQWLVCVKCNCNLKTIFGTICFTFIATDHSGIISHTDWKCLSLDFLQNIAALFLPDTGWKGNCFKISSITSTSVGTVNSCTIMQDGFFYIKWFDALLLFEICSVFSILTYHFASYFFHFYTFFLLFFTFRLLILRIAGAMVPVFIPLCSLPCKSTDLITCAADFTIYLIQTLWFYADKGNIFINV